MKGKLIHTEHRTSDLSEYYFNNSSKLILEVKNLDLIELENINIH